MSNAFSGQTQMYQSPQMGGFGGFQQPTMRHTGMGPFSGMGGYGGGYGTAFGGYGGGYDTMFGNMGMGGGYGGFGGYQQPSLMPAYQPTVNDLFGQYFSQQYYGGPAFNPFAATSLFGGGFGGGRGGMGGRMRRRRQMFEDFFQPEQPAQSAQPQQPPQAQPAVPPQPEPPPQAQPAVMAPQVTPSFFGFPPSPVYGNVPQFAELAPAPFVPVAEPMMVSSPFTRTGREFFGGYR